MTKEVNQETICAIATAQGGAIGIIRVSGLNAIEITDSIFVSTGKRLCDSEPYSLTFGHIYNDEGEMLDEVLVALYRAPHSYTGEDATEIMCHGSSYILQQIMQLLIVHGCRSARPGEYTQRAFLNGKMDLSQAEAVADLIASSDAATHRLAMSQMRGGFGLELSKLRQQLVHFTSLIELELDFSEEDVEFVDRTQLYHLANHIETKITELLNSFKVGNALKNGIPVAIIGETNAGKSTLLNQLLHEDKAIVSDIHGTTRDVIEDTINLNGITFRFIDTAGIRETNDQIETLGIQRTFQKIEQADIILWLIDSSTMQKQSIESMGNMLLSNYAEKKIIRLFNKIDLLSESQLKELYQLPPFREQDDTLYISAEQENTLIPLQKLLITYSSIPKISQKDIIITNIRHYEALQKAQRSIKRVQKGLSTHNLTSDLISQDIRECTFYLSDIIGEVTSESILENIFKNFCIGK